MPFDEFPNKRNYLNKVLHYDVLLNVKNSVSHKRDFVEASLNLWWKECEFGIYNVVNTGHLTAFDVLTLLLWAFSMSGLCFLLALLMF